MTGLSFTWKLRYQGWAFCTISDDRSLAKASASDLTRGPEDLLRAVTAITQGARTARAAFEAEPTQFRWLFQRRDSNVDISLAKAPDRSSPESAESVIWIGSHAVGALARSVLEGFYQALLEIGEESYRSQWGRAFPRDDVEALSNAWRQITT